MSLRLRITAFLGANLIRLLGRTWRVQMVDAHYADQAREHSPAIIYVFWHGRMLPLSYRYRGSSAHLLASKHADGELMGQIVRRLGFGHIRGSSTRGGAQAIRELVRALQKGFDLGITVDGPTGPKHVVKPGTLEIAKLSGASVVPITSSSKRHWTFTSWDAFELPQPFARVLIRQGEPITVPKDADGELIEEKRKSVEKALRSITEINDRETGNG